MTVRGRCARFAMPLLLSVALSAPPSRAASPMHVEAEGVFLRIDGGLLVKIVGGTVSGPINLPVGFTTERIDVSFLDENGLEFIPPSPALLQWTINPVVASLSQVDPWAIKLQGVNVGSTNLVIKIFFQDHVDYTSPPIPTRVVASSDVPQVDVGETRLLVAPNPIGREAWLSIPAMAPGSGVIRLLDANGRVAWTEAIEVGSARSLELPVDRLSAGTYWLRLQVGSDWLASRVVCLR